MKKWPQYCGTHCTFNKNLQWIHLFKGLCLFHYLNIAKYKKEQVRTNLIIYPLKFSPPHHDTSHPIPGCNSSLTSSCQKLSSEYILSISDNMQKKLHPKDKTWNFYELMMYLISQKILHIHIYNTLYNHLLRAGAYLPYLFDDRYAETHDWP